MEEDQQIIEKAKESLSFLQQLQEQVTACRRLLSKTQLIDEVPFCKSAVKELETILWAKLRNDEEYQEAIKKLDNEFEVEKKEKNPQSIKAGIDMNYAREQFRLLLIFIDRKNLMPIENG